MDSKERVSDIQEVMRQATGDALSALWIAAPCQIINFNPDPPTADIKILQLTRRVLQQPTVELRKAQAKDWFSWDQPQTVQKCPVVFIRGGGFTIMAPPQPGDEALAIFAHRSIDEWWANGDSSQRSDLRQFSVMDAFVIAGVFSQPNAPAGVDPSALQITDETGAIKLRMDQTGITLYSPQQITMNTPQVTIHGGLSVDGTIGTSTGVYVDGGLYVTQGANIAGRDFMGHIHPAPGGNTGPVI